jgi:hypothetical protein
MWTSESCWLKHYESPLLSPFVSKGKREEANSIEKEHIGRRNFYN